MSGGARQFTAAPLDQFGMSMVVPLTWTVSGGGQVDSLGKFIAGSSPGGPFILAVRSEKMSVSASLNVIPVSGNFPDNNAGGDGIGGGGGGCGAASSISLMLAGIAVSLRFLLLRPGRVKT